MIASRLANIIGDSISNIHINKADREKYILERCEERLKKFNAFIVQSNLINRMTDEEYQKKMGILDELEEGLRGSYFTELFQSRCLRLNAVSPFGSSITELANRKGDLDIVLSIEDLRHTLTEDDGKYLIRDLLDTIFREIAIKKLWPARNFRDLQCIGSARIPIVKCVVDNVDIDISISLEIKAPTAYLSSQVVNISASYDRRFIELCSYVKHWMKSMINPRNEKESESYVPKSCVISLMVLHFMVHYKILPKVHSMHPEKLNPTHVTWKMVRAGELGAFGITKDQKAKWRQENYTEASIGVLFLLFLDYYTNIVDLRKDVLVMETATCQPKKPRIDLRDTDPSMTLVVSDVYNRDQNYARRIDNVPKLIREMKMKYEEVIALARTAVSTVAQSISVETPFKYSMISSRVANIVGDSISNLNLNKVDREKYILERCEERLKKFNESIVQSNLVNRMTDAEYNKKMTILNELKKGLRKKYFAELVNLLVRGR